MTKLKRQETTRVIQLIVKNKLNNVQLSTLLCVLRERGKQIVFQ